MWIITTMCDAICNCCSSIFNAIKNLFGYGSDEGYELITSPNSNSQTSEASPSKSNTLPLKDTTIGNNSQQNSLTINEMTKKSPDIKVKEEIAEEAIIKKDLGFIERKDQNLPKEKIYKEETNHSVSSFDPSLSSSNIINFNFEKKEKSSLDDVSKINLFKIESDRSNFPTDTTSATSTTKSHETIVPQSITQVLQKTPEISGSTVLSKPTQDSTKKEVTGIEKIKQSLDSQSNEKPKEAKPILAKKSSSKISGLAGKLGNINFAPPGAGKIGPSKPSAVIEKESQNSESSIKPRAEIEDKTDSSNNEENKQTLSSVSDILKDRLKSTNKLRRPPSKKFLKESRIFGEDKNKLEESTDSVSELTIQESPEISSSSDTKIEESINDQTSDYSNEKSEIESSPRASSFQKKEDSSELWTQTQEKSEHESTEKEKQIKENTQESIIDSPMSTERETKAFENQDLLIEQTKNIKKKSDEDIEMQNSNLQMDKEDFKFSKTENLEDLQNESKDFDLSKENKSQGEIDKQTEFGEMTFPITPDHEMIKNPHPSIESLTLITEISDGEKSNDADESQSISRSTSNKVSRENLIIDETSEKIKKKSTEQIMHNIPKKFMEEIPKDELFFTMDKSEEEILGELQIEPEIQESQSPGYNNKNEIPMSSPFMTGTGEEFLSAEEIPKSYLDQIKKND